MPQFPRGAPRPTAAPRGQRHVPVHGEGSQGSPVALPPREWPLLSRRACGGLYRHNTGEKLKVCSTSFFQALERPPAALGCDRSVPGVVGMSAADTVLG